MKRLTTFLMALLLTWIGANAQTVIHECVAEVGHWTTTGNTEIALNTWSTEADASGMETPFCQIWVASNSTLPTALISHETEDLYNLESGYYAVSMDIRIFSEAGNEIGEGTTFNANDVSEDLDTGSDGHEGAYGTETEVYGTYHLLVNVTDGTLDINIQLPTNPTYNWIAWKNLNVSYLGTTATLEVVTGNMNSTVQTTMTAAVTAWNTALAAGNIDMTLFAAAEEAIAAAEESVAYYKEIADLAENLDSDGQAVWVTTETYTKYSDNTLETTDDFGEDMAAAQMAQTTANTDWSCVMRYLGEWTGSSSEITVDGSKAEEDYQTTQYSGTADSPTKILYKTLEGIPAGTYSVSFYAEANATQNRGFTSNSGNNIAQVFANTTVQDITVNEYTVVGNGDSHSWLTTDLYTLTCTVKLNGTLEFGIQNVGTGGNWYTAMASNLSLVGLLATPEIDEATASATIVSPGEEVTLQFEYADPTGDYELTGEGFTSGDISVTYSGGGAFTFTVPEDATGTFSITIPAGALAYTDAEVESAEQTIDFAVSATIDEGDYLIVDAEGNYLGGGLVYGTEASIIGKPQFIGFEAQANGSYHLNSYQYNNANAHYLGSNLYFDSTPVDWAIVEMEGGYAIFGTADTGTGYLTSNGFQTVATVEADPYVWTLVTMEDVVASMDEATEDAPVDVTALIAAPELKRNSNTSYHPTWTVTGYDGTGTPSNYAFGGGSAIANCAESYHSTNGFNFNQELTLPLAGTYKLSAKGFYRDDNSTTLLLPVLYADDLTSTFPEITRTDEYLGVADNMANAYQEFLLGLHTIDAITIVAKENGETVTIGFKGEDTSLWQIMGELELQYLGVIAELDYDYDVTWALANPSFEVDNVANLSEDETRSTTTSGDHTGGAYTIANGLTGWTLVAPTNTDATRPVADLMTAACQRTDDDYGAPGTPIDGDQMLYLRNSWTTGTASVTQVVTLPAGEYKLTVDSKCVTTNANHSAMLVVGDDKNITLPTHSIYNGDDLAWDTSSLKFEVGEGGADVTIGVNVSFDGHPGLSVALDNFKLYSVDAIEKEISWTMTDAGWGTMILPFDASIPEGLTLYADDAITVSDSELTVDEEKAAASIVANTPYLVSGDAGSYTFSGTPENTADTYTVGVLTGTLVDLAVAKGAAFATDGTMYLLQNQEEVDGVAFYPIIAATEDADNSAEATLDAYHCYLTIESEDGEASPTKLSIVLPGAGEETGIVAVEGDVIANDAIYDLSGRRVAKAVKGVYIQNGKKVLVK